MSSAVMCELWEPLAVNDG